ncbi:MAG: TrmH family RNA methyltransferase [Acidimicrobiia bacterium]
MANLITSGSNPGIRALAALHKRSVREETGTFLIEGRREIERASAAGLLLVKIVRRVGIDPLDMGVDELEVGPSAFEKIAYGRDGLVAVAKTPRFALSEWSPPDLVLVAVAIEKPGNLGAMLRTCDAAGAGLLVVDPITDVTNPNTVRASTGALFTVPIAVASSDETIVWLSSFSFRVVATTVAGGLPPWEIDMTRRVAIVIGNEDRGLSDPWLANSFDRVTVPQLGEVDSLNASVTAGVLLYESVRQRTVS